MSQAGYTPIQLYYSTTASNVPSAGNLSNGELALNIASTDMSVYLKNSSGNVKKLFSNPATLVYPTVDGTNGQVLRTDGSGNLSWTTVVSTPGGSNTQVQYNSGGNFAGSANLTFDGTNLTSGGTVSATKLIPTGGVATGNGMYLPASNTLAWSNNGSETMRLDSSGNLGLGVTPSAFDYPWRALQITPGAGYNAPSILACAYDSTYLLSNAVYTSGFKYIANNYATQYQQYQGQHRWFTAPSGTAGNAITFTQAMTLDASGMLGIGLTPVANNGILQLNSYASVQAMMEKATVSATAATGTINFDAATQPVLYYTTNASGNWTINIRGSASLSLNNMMQTGQSLTLAFLATNGSTAYYQSALTIDGSSVTPKWQGGTAPTAGNASAIDAYVLTVIKTGSATFTVLASQTKFA